MRFTFGLVTFLGVWCFCWMWLPDSIAVTLTPVIESPEAGQDDPKKFVERHKTLINRMNLQVSRNGDEAERGSKRNEEVCKRWRRRELVQDFRMAGEKRCPCPITYRCGGPALDGLNTGSNMGYPIPHVIMRMQRQSHKPVQEFVYHLGNSLSLAIWKCMVFRNGRLL